MYYIAITTAKNYHNYVRVLHALVHNSVVTVSSHVTPHPLTLLLGLLLQQLFKGIHSGHWTLKVLCIYKLSFRDYIIIL